MTKEYSAYFNDKAVIFTGERPEENPAGTYIANDIPSIEEVTSLFDGANDRIIVLCENPQLCFMKFCSGFVNVEAAGGIVWRKDGSALMIFRRGRWDLPKGHIEPDENIADAAIREVKEECGLNVRILRPIVETRHFYNTYGKWEMKLTHWFDMEYDGNSYPIPQTEEDISRVEWLSGEDLALAIEQSYATIHKVFAERINLM